MKLSPNFSLEEFTFSQTASRHSIDNTPPAVIIENLIITAGGMERVRTLLGNKPITITSGYRSPVLNKKIGSGPRSDHPNGWCVDFICPKYGTPVQIVNLLKDSDIEFDQLIEEGTWVHISFSPKNRRQVMTASFDSKGKASYKMIS